MQLPVCLRQVVEDRLDSLQGVAVWVGATGRQVAVCVWWTQLQGGCYYVCTPSRNQPHHHHHPTPKHTHLTSDECVGEALRLKAATRADVCLSAALLSTWGGLNTVCVCCLCSGYPPSLAVYAAYLNAVRPTLAPILLLPLLCCCWGVQVSCCCGLKRHGV